MVSVDTSSPSNLAPWDLALVGGHVLTLDSGGAEYPKSLIGVCKGKIIHVGPYVESDAIRAATVLRTDGCLVLPSFINLHTHAGATLFRGQGSDLPLLEWLHKVTFPLEEKWVNSEFVYWSTLLAAAEWARSGVSCVNDMYFFPSASAKALSQVGLKGVLGLAIPSVHRANPYTKGKLIGQIEAERKEFADYPEQELALAPHAVYSLSESDWREVASLARVFNLRVNVHVSESQSEIETSKKMFGMSPPQFFESVGLFESPCVAAHAVHVSEEDLDIFRRFNVSVAHNPESNLRLANGICPVVDLRAKGIQVGFGTDSAMTNNDLDLLAEAGTGIKLQSLKYGPGRLSAKDAVTMLTKEAAAILGRGGETGSIELGKSADIQVLDLAGWHAQPRHDPYFSLMYALKSSDVRHHLVAGRVILKDFKIQTLDEAALKKEVQSWSRTLSG